MEKHLRFIYCCFVFLIALHKSTSYVRNPPWKNCVTTMTAISNAWKMIESPGYPNGMSSQIQCSWIMVSKPKTRIRLAFQNFNLTGNMGHCYTQYIELIDLKKQVSMGKICGTKRAGDFVSYGNELRLDLLADTSTTPHKGFQLQFKQVSFKEKSGFTSKFSFPNGGKKKRKPIKNSINSDKKLNPNKQTRLWKTSNSGKISFNHLVNKNKMLQQPKSVKKIKSTNQLTNASQEETYLERNISDQKQATTTKNTVKVHSQSQKNQLELMSYKEDEINLYFVIGISVGLMLFLIFLAILIKRCFFKKKEKSDFYKENEKTFSKPNETYSTEKQTPLPMLEHSTKPKPERLYSFIDDEEKNKILEYEGYSGRNIKHKRHETNYFQRNAADLATVRSSRRGVPNVPYEFLDFLNREAVLVEAGDSASNVNGNFRDVNLNEQKDSKLPTMKRKFSQWEKDQLKIASRKMQQ